MGHLAAGHRNMPDHGISSPTRRRWPARTVAFRRRRQAGCWRHASAAEQRRAMVKLLGSRNANKARRQRQSAPSLPRHPPPAPHQPDHRAADQHMLVGRPGGGSGAARPVQPAAMPAFVAAMNQHQVGRHGRTPAQCSLRRRRHGVHPQASAWPPCRPAVGHARFANRQPLPPAPRPGCGLWRWRLRVAHVAQASASRSMPLRQALHDAPPLA